MTVSVLVRTTVAAALATICLLSAVTPAVAAIDPGSRRVGYADLNLDDDRDRARLDRRIASAARQICASNRVGVAAKMLDSNCAKAAIASAKRQIRG